MLINSVLVGSLLLVLTVLIHSWGTVTLVRFMHRWRWSLNFGKNTGVIVLSGIAVFLLMLHLLQVICWAAVYIWLTDSPFIKSTIDALYFSMVTYTTVGYGDIILTGEWRLLSGIQSMNGILLFGWSTALLFMVVQKIWLQEAQALPPSKKENP